MPADEGSRIENPVLAALRPEVRQRLLRLGSSRHCEAGERIFREGEKADRIFALEGGVVQVSHQSNKDARVVVKIFSAPAIFGEVEAFSGLKYLESVDALVPCDLLVFPAQGFLDALRHDAEAATTMILDLAARFAIAIERERSQTYDPATVKLASYLLEHIYWQRPSDDEQLVIRLTQEQMAEATGATRRSVAQDLELWTRQGLLARRGRFFLLKKPDALARYCEPTRLGVGYRIGEPLKPLVERVGKRIAKSKGKGGARTKKR